MGLLGKSDCAKPTLDAKAGAPSTMAITALLPGLNQREHSSACNMLLLPVNANATRLVPTCYSTDSTCTLLAAVCFDAASQRSGGLTWQSQCHLAIVFPAQCRLDHKP